MNKTIFYIVIYNKVEKKGIPKESPTKQNGICCRLGLIESVHGFASYRPRPLLPV
jgi:hypothetical protein